MSLNEQILNINIKGNSMGWHNSNKGHLINRKAGIIIDRAAIKQELNIEIPDTATERQFVLSTPDSYYTHKQSDIPLRSIMDENNNEKQVFLEVFSLKMLGLLVCRDKTEIKELLLAETVMTDKKDYIEMSNPLLKRAVKKLLYFSEILPKKYYNEIVIKDEKPSFKDNDV